jgi:hypothetical protein
MTKSLTDLRTQARKALDELYERISGGPRTPDVGAKASRLLALFDAEDEHRRHGHRELIEERAWEIARRAGVEEIYSYHVLQAFVELFNQDPTFKAATHAHVDRLDWPRRGST